MIIREIKKIDFKFIVQKYYSMIDKIRNRINELSEFVQNIPVYCIRGKIEDISNFIESTLDPKDNFR